MNVQCTLLILNTIYSHCLLLSVELDFSYFETSIIIYVERVVICAIHICINVYDVKISLKHEIIDLREFDFGIKSVIT